VTAPTRTDPVAAAASEIIGGPFGRYAALTRHTARSAWQPAAAVLIGLSSLTISFAVLQKAHCFSKGWNTPDQFWHACYSDLPIVYQSSGLGHAMPYLPGAQPLDQPLISGLAMWLVGLAVPDGSALVQQQWYFALWAVLITVIVMVLVAVTAASVPAAPWRAAHVALSPVLVLAGLVSVDLLGVMLASAALWAWGRSRVLMAGVLLGLAISARSYPLGPARRHRPARGALGPGRGVATAGGNGSGHLVRGEPALARDERGCLALGLSQLVGGRGELWLGVDGADADGARASPGRRDTARHPGLGGRPGRGCVLRP